MISLKLQFLFIHVPKTAGNAIQSILRNYSEEKITKTAPHHDGIERFEIRSDAYNIRKHSSLSEYQAQLGKNVIDPLYKFTCIRNPWDRAISFYFSPHRGKVTWNREQFIIFLDQVRPVTTFISSIESDSADDCFGNMDYYIRYERLNEDFRHICSSIRIPHQDLPLRNASSHDHYTAYYDSELVDIVGARYQDEIRFFNYEFGG